MRRRRQQDDETANAPRIARRSRVASVGRISGPLLALLVFASLPQDDALTAAGRTTAAIGVLMAAWWMTEALPLSATALVPIVAFPLLGVLSVDEATSPYADPNIFLFMGGFMIALAIQRWGLHERIALLTVRAVGTRPTRLIAGFMLATAFLSMWVSNTATTVMMLPIGVSVLVLVLGHSGIEEGTTLQDSIKDADARNFAVALMLGIAFGASIGSLATLIGTPPNLILAAFVEQQYGIDIGFGEWMRLGLPLAAVMLVIAWLVLTRVIFRSGLREIPGGRQMIEQELSALGRMSRPEWTVLAVFVTTAFLWVFRQPLSSWDSLTDLLPFVANLTDTSIAIAAALALFLLPVSRRRGERALDWKTAQKLPWGILLLFGGGLSLAAAVQSSGLDAYIGQQVEAFGVLPIVLLVAGVASVVLLLTEVTSNTATAATFLPILGGIAVGLDIMPLVLLVPAALAATCAFMLPVATPPNAIVFGSGYVTIGQMMRAGVALNVIGVLLITLVVFLLGPWALGLSF